MSGNTSVPHVILHIGLGSFHRAHQAVYLNQLHLLGDDAWVLVGGNTRPDMPDVIAALQKSDPDNELFVADLDWFDARIAKVAPTL